MSFLDEIAHPAVLVPSYTPHTHMTTFDVSHTFLQDSIFIVLHRFHFICALYRDGERILLNVELKSLVNGQNHIPIK